MVTAVVLRNVTAVALPCVPLSLNKKKKKTLLEGLRPVGLYFGITGESYVDFGRYTPYVVGVGRCGVTEYKFLHTSFT